MCCSAEVSSGENAARERVLADSAPPPNGKRQSALIGASFCLLFFKMSEISPKQAFVSMADRYAPDGNSWAVVVRVAQACGSTHEQAADALKVRKFGYSPM
jgi:hypothetical protein